MMFSIYFMFVCEKCNLPNINTTFEILSKPSMNQIKLNTAMIIIGRSNYITLKNHSPPSNMSVIT